LLDFDKSEIDRFESALPENIPNVWRHAIACSAYLTYSKLKLEVERDLSLKGVD